MASTRRLAAILAADIVGYSRLMGLDEAGRFRRCESIAPLPIPSLRSTAGGWSKRRAMAC
jgi:hypothetical protein